MRYVVLYPIEGLPQGKVFGGETVDLDDETAAPLVGVAALRPVQEEPVEEPTHDEEVNAASPEAQGNEAAAEPPRTAAKKAPAKGRGKK